MDVLFEKKRFFLRKIVCFVLIFTIISVAAFESHVARADAPINSTERTNSTEGFIEHSMVDIHSGYSIGYMGSEWSDSRNAWAFNYRFVDVGSGRY